MSDYIIEMRKLIGSRLLMGPAAGVLIFDDKDRVLLLRRTDNDMWGIPGGGLEPGERVEEAAKREVEEEVGLKCGELELFGIYSGPEMFYRYPNGDEIYCVSMIYICREYSGELRVCAVEGKEAVFFAIEEIPEAINPLDRPVIADLKGRYEEIMKSGN